VKIGPVDAEVIGLTKIVKNKHMQNISSPSAAFRSGELIFKYINERFTNAHCTQQSTGTKYEKQEEGVNVSLDTRVHESPKKSERNGECESDVE